MNEIVRGARGDLNYDSDGEQGSGTSFPSAFFGHKLEHGLATHQNLAGQPATPEHLTTSTPLPHSNVCVDIRTKSTL
jgi:hypothetical protein